MGDITLYAVRESSGLLGGNVLFASSKPMWLLETVRSSIAQSKIQFPSHLVPGKQHFPVSGYNGHEAVSIVVVSSCWSARPVDN